MKKNSKLVLSLLIVAATIVSCSKKSTLETAIPKDAAMVVRVDMKSLSKKANYNPFENQVIKGYVEMMKATLTDDQKKILDDFIKDPNSLGVNVINNIYVFYDAKGYTGIVLGLNNSKKLYDNLLKISPETKELIKVDKDVYSFSSPQTSIAWNKDKMVIMINSASFSGVATSATDNIPVESYLSQKKEDSFCAIADYKEFAADKNDITAYYSTKNYIQYYDSLLPRLIAINMGESTLQTKILHITTQILNAADNIAYNSIGGCSFENGKIVFSGNYKFDSKEAEAKYNSLKTLKGSIKGTLNNFISKKSAICFALNLNGKDILEDLNTLNLTNPMDSLSKELGFDVKGLIAALNGDMIFSVDAIDFKNNNMPFSASMFVSVDTTTNIPTMLREFLLKDKSKKIKEVKKDNYIADNKFGFGIKDGVLYATNDSLTYANFEKGGEANSSLDKIKNQLYYFGGDFARIKEDAMMSIDKSSSFYDITEEGLSLISTYETKIIDNYNSLFEINFTDTKTNSLEQIFKYIDKAINLTSRSAGIAQ